jgi:hypothetical protein
MRGHKYVHALRQKVCTMTWSGPNLPARTTSVLNLHNITRNQTGNYQCTARNDVSSKTSDVVNVTFTTTAVLLLTSLLDNSRI